MLLKQFAQDFNAKISKYSLEQCATQTAVIYQSLLQFEFEKLIQWFSILLEIIKSTDYFVRMGYSSIFFINMQTQKTKIK